MINYDHDELDRIVLGFMERHGYTHLCPKAALIDMDGTLFDSMPHHADAWKHVADDAGIEADRDEFFLYEGRTGASTINILFNRQWGRDATDDEIKRFYGKKTEYFNEMPAVDAMPGALEMLTILKGAGIKRVLVTGSGQNSLISRINADFPDMFHESLRITARDVTRGKPDPEPYLKAMELAGARPWESIAIENAPLGVESAARSGAFTIAVTTGPIPKEEMAKAGATIIFDSMPQCAKTLPRLLDSIYRYKQ